MEYIIPENCTRAEPAAAPRTDVERVTIPRGVVEIAPDAFRGWSALREVAFAENSCLKKIGR